MSRERCMEIGPRILRDPSVETVTRAFPEAERQGLFLVGGALRDAWLGRPMKDFDFVVRGDVQALAGEVARSLSAKYVLLDETWGVVRLICHVKRPVEDRVTFDFAAMQGSHISEDLARRDFTCNAMAIPLAKPVSEWATSDWLDPFGGLKDLDARVLRMVHPSAFQEDPLRMLRAFRIACSIGLTIDPETLESVGRERQRLMEAAGERIGDEFIRLLSCRGAHATLCEMDGCGLLSVLFPEFDPLKGLEQSRPHHLDVWHHTLEALRWMEILIERGPDEMPRWSKAVDHWVRGTARTPALLKLATLFHDIGKHETRTMDPAGGIHFYGHEKSGTDMVPAMMQRLRTSRNDRDRVRDWVRHHMGPIHLTQALRSGHLTERAKVRFLRHLGPDAPGSLLLSLADVSATGGRETEADWKRSHAELLHSLFSLCFEKGAVSTESAHLVSGKELIDALGLAPGPMVGRLLRRLDEARIQGEIVDKAGAIEYASRLLNRAHVQ